MFDNEESAIFGSAYAGSNAAIGRANDALLEQRARSGPENYMGRTRLELLATYNAALNAAAGDRRRPTSEEGIRASLVGRAGFVDLFLAMGFDLEQIKQLQVSFLETHIEQADSLANSKVENPEEPLLGLVDRISTPLRVGMTFAPTERPEMLEPNDELNRYHLNITGVRGHSGGMPHAERQDAFVGAAAVVLVIESLRLEGHQIEITDLRPVSGEFSQTSVPGNMQLEVVCTEDVRTLLFAKLASSAADRNVSVAIEDRGALSQPTRPLSHDVVRAAMGIIGGVSELFTQYDGGEGEIRALRGTVTVLTVNHKTGEIELTLDVRNASGTASPGQNRTIRFALMRRVVRQVRRMHPGELHVRCRYHRDIDELNRAIDCSTPTQMSESLRRQARAVAAERSIRLQDITSYPGHDASNAAQGIEDERFPSLFIPIETFMAFMASMNGSHNPDEAATDFDLGVTQVWTEAMLRKLVVA